MSLKIILEEGAKVPIRGSKLSAGYDLFSNEESLIPAGERKLISTGIRIRFPEGHYARVAPRSGWAVKKSIDVGAGVIDIDYAGIVMILLINNSKEEIKIPRHERIAQLILEKISNPEIEIADILDLTERGDGGFGSTGNK